MKLIRECSLKETPQDPPPTDPNSLNWSSRAWRVSHRSVSYQPYAAKESESELNVMFTSLA